MNTPGPQLTWLHWIFLACVLAARVSGPMLWLYLLNPSAPQLRHYRSVRRRTTKGGAR